MTTLPTYAHNDIGMPGLIRSVYDAALDASRWQEFLARFAAEFSSQTTMIFGQDFSDGSVEVTGGTTSLAAHHGVDEDSMASFAAHYCRTNVWTQDERMHHEGRIVNGSKFYPDKHLPRTEWHCDWLRPLDLFYTLAAVVESAGTAPSTSRPCAASAAAPTRPTRSCGCSRWCHTCRRRLHCTGACTAPRPSRMHRCR